MNLNFDEFNLEGNVEITFDKNLIQSDIVSGM